MNLHHVISWLRCCFKKQILFIVGGAIAVLQFSCAPSKCVLCENDNTTFYQVEMKENASTIKGKSRINTFITPVPLDVSKKKKEIFIVDCEGQEPYKMSPEQLEELIKNNNVKVDTSDVKRIITSSDADIPPYEVTYDSLRYMFSGTLCNRYRKAVKFEIRGMFGIRDFKKEGLPIPSYDGGTKKQIIGFGVGGSNVVIGPEVAILPRLFHVGKRGSFNLGLMTGYWPVDGSNFIPVSIHPRLTINEFSAPLIGSCNAGYLFGDIGTAWAFDNNEPKEVPFLKDNNMPTSWFWDLGFGFDLWKTKNRDLSFDMGWRTTNLALPINEEYINCVDKEITENPVRTSGQVFFRIGLTW